MKLVLVRVEYQVNFSEGWTLALLMYTSLTLCIYINHFISKFFFLSENQKLLNLNGVGNSAYHGQVLLFPPTNVADLKNSGIWNSTASVGLVAVKKEGEPCTDWRFLYKDTLSVDSGLLSTLCRQMGFTDFVRGSVTTRSSFEKRNVGLNFSVWDNEM